MCLVVPVLALIRRGKLLEETPKNPWGLHCPVCAYRWGMVAGAAERAANGSRDISGVAERSTAVMAWFAKHAFDQ